MCVPLVIYEWFEDSKIGFTIIGIKFTRDSKLGNVACFQFNPFYTLPVADKNAGRLRCRIPWQKRIIVKNMQLLDWGGLA
jgi:hypothetical protein